jgi:hypothetical protein
MNLIGQSLFDGVFKLFQLPKFGTILVLLPEKFELECPKLEYETAPIADGRSDPSSLEACCKTIPFGGTPSNSAPVGKLYISEDSMLASYIGISSPVFACVGCPGYPLEESRLLV